MLHHEITKNRDTLVTTQDHSMVLVVIQITTNVKKQHRFLVKDTRLSQLCKNINQSLQSTLQYLPSSQVYVTKQKHYLPLLEPNLRRQKQKLIHNYISRHYL